VGNGVQYMLSKGSYDVFMGNHNSKTVCQKKINIILFVVCLFISNKPYVKRE